MEYGIRYTKDGLLFFKTDKLALAEAFFSGGMDAAAKLNITEFNIYLVRRYPGKDWQVIRSRY